MGATFAWRPLSPRAPGDGPKNGAGRQPVAIASPSPIVRQAARPSIEGAAGRAIDGETLETVLAWAGEDDVLLIDHACASPAAMATLPFDRVAVILLGAEDRGLIGEYRRAGSAGYLIKPLRRSLVARVLAAAGNREPSVSDDERIETAEPEPAIQTAISGTRVLLAEDNPINAMLAGAMLRKQGCRVDQGVYGQQKSPRRHPSPTISS